MKQHIFFLLICVGCSSSGTAVIDDGKTELDVEDFVEPSDSEPSDNEPSDNEPSNDGPSDEPDPPPEDKTWTGERVIDFPTNSYCTETQDESGEEITRTSEGSEYVDACPDCSEIYRVSLSPEVICYDTVTFGSERIVGLLPSGGGITLVYFYQNGGNVGYYQVAELSGSGSQWSYSYQADYEYYYTTYPYTVDGSFVIE